MNAKITISVDIKDVPQEINNILLKIEQQLDSLRHSTIAVIDEQSELKKLVLIEEIRKKLSLLDTKYDDCYSVLVGYLKMTTEGHIQKTAANKKEEVSDK